MSGPLADRWFNWVKGILTKGDFGPAMAYGGKEVTELLRNACPGRFCWRLIGTRHLIRGGHRDRHLYRPATIRYWADNMAAFFAFILTSIPRFSLALIVAYILVFGLGQQHRLVLFPAICHGALVVG